MKKLFACIFILALFTGQALSAASAKVVSCKGEVMVKNLDLKDFTSIEVNGSAQIIISQQEDFEVSVRANKDVFDYLDYKVRGGTLYIETKDGVNLLARVYDVIISLPLVENVRINGSGDLTLKDDYSADTALTLKVNGAGDLNMDSVEVPALHIQVNGAGDIQVKDADVNTLAVSVNGAASAAVAGKADVAFFKLTGAASMDARHLEAGSIETNRSGVSRILLNK